MSSSSELGAGGGLTLVETLVALGVVSILLAISLPVLSETRRSADSAVCLATLAGLGQGFEAASSGNGGYWPNAFHADEEVVTVHHSGSTTMIGLAYFDQWAWWTGGLIGASWEPGDGGRVFACPSALRATPESTEGAPHLDGFFSYRYSVSLFTSHLLWNPADPEARTHPEDFRLHVPTASVAYPSAKVVLSENEDRHDGRSPIPIAGATSANLLFADAHAARVGLAGAKRALEFRPRRPGWVRPTGPIPFSASPGGYTAGDF